jgi:hypothetical protein
MGRQANTEGVCALDLRCCSLDRGGAQAGGARMELYKGVPVERVREREHQTRKMSGTVGAHFLDLQLQPSLLLSL